MLSLTTQTFSASRSILHNVGKSFSSSLHSIPEEKLSSIPEHPPMPHDAHTFFPSKTLMHYDASIKTEKPLDEHSNAKKTKEKHVPLKTKKIGSVEIPQLPTPPAVDKNTLDGKITVPKEQHSKLSVKKNKKQEADKQEHKKEPAKHSDKKDKLKHEEKKTHIHESKKPEPKEHDKIINEKLKKEEKDQQMVRFYFEDATLENLVRYIEELYDVKFFTDDDLNPVPTGGALLKGHKITFTTNKPLTRKEAWDLFLKFLDMAGLSVVPGEVKNFYRITTLSNANKEVLPTYFDTKLDLIPNNSTKVRYVFFVKNTPLGTIQQVVSAFSSSTAGPILSFPDLNALIITDKGVNIRSLMKIVKEFDEEMPEAMSVLKLKRSDATDVAKLYQSLTQAEAPKGAARFMTQRNQPKSLYFPANARIIPEPRTNSLILLGPKAALAKIEEFIVKHVDVELDMPYSPLHIYKLQHTQAANIAQILNSTATKFGSGTPAAQYGGVRDGNQYFGPMTITPETSGNRLVIKAEENDYIKLKEIIKKLDVPQPQAIIEVLIVDVQTSNDKIFGTQIRNKSENSFIKNVDFQRTGLPVTGGNYAGVVNASNGSLLGNLISLASSAASGSTMLSVGTNKSGIWGIMSLLQQSSKTDIISNPFLLTTNNYKANVTLGSTRNVVTSTVTTNGAAQSGYSQMSANLSVSIVPQISTDGSIQMDMNIVISDFTASSVSSGDTISKTINTSAIVQNREVLVLGGIVKNKITHEIRKTPLLGDIPGLGWLFKSKAKVATKSNVLIFVSPQIIYPGMEETSTEYMQHKANVTNEIAKKYGETATKDPINNFFFQDNNDETIEYINDFMNQSKPRTKKEKKPKVTKATRKPSKKRRRVYL